jgi:17beta-estradiol 17-dehydrogenase / very-long-chain 3-oxoacyl-CoA reductase
VSIDEFNHGWAVVTGATDGIGREIVEQLARRNFNIVAISRSEEKLKQVCEEVRTSSGNANIEYIQADFSESHKDPVAFYGGLAKQLEGKDISALFNNVGIMIEEKFTDRDPKSIEQELSVNAWSTVFLTYYLLPGMDALFEKTGRKSLLVNLSSSAAMFCMQTFGVYGGTKKIQDNFSRALSYEYRRSVKVVSFKPMVVRTPLTRAIGMKEKGLFSITTN